MQVSTKTYSPQEYLELEEQAEQRNEYLDGRIIPMAGGKPNHNQLAINLTSALNYNLKKKPYRVFMSDLRLWIPDYRLYTYPDVMVVNTPLVFAEDRTDTVTNPLEIAEILSDSTEKYDRGDKFSNASSQRGNPYSRDRVRMYRSIPSFREYVLISQTAMQVEKFSKNDSQQWVLSEYVGKDSKLTFDSFEFEISLAELYDRVEFE
ncbi:Uma2 family endonuclease [Pleurocapsales cyanobacterium LEGE 10410]|nr:Uma2 family endonuclease [Pleurocapsales cyanobacterium LEGE 10410]